MKIVDVEGTRSIQIVQANGAVFVSCGGFCIELDPWQFRQALMKEFGMVYDWDIGNLVAA